MSALYGTIKGAKKPVTCRGTNKSGICAHVRTWNDGIKVQIDYREEDGTYSCEIFQTRGSNAPNIKTLINSLTLKG